MTTAICLGEGKIGKPCSEPLVLGKLNLDTPENFQGSYPLRCRELQDLLPEGTCLYPRTNRKLLMQSAHRFVPSRNTELLLLNLLQQSKTPGKRTETLTKVQKHSGASHRTLRQSGVLFCGVLPKVSSGTKHRTEQATARKSLTSVSGSMR